MRRVVFFVVASALLSLASGGIASAHPLGNFTINHYLGLTVRPDWVTLDYVIDMAEIPAFQERAVIDGDGDGVLSSAELAVYASARCDELRSGITLRADGRATRLSVFGATAALGSGQAGLSTLRLECAYRSELASEPAGVWGTLAVADTNYTDRIGWREITAHADGAVLDTDLPSQSASARLTAYPQDLLSSPLDMRTGTVRFTVGGTIVTAPRALTAPVPDAPARPVDPVTALLASADLSALGVVVALLIACGLGVMHALSPGHGKTVIAAYLVGTSGSRRQALVLGLVVALSHTAGVLVLGAVTLAASTVIAPERLYPYLSAAAGVIVLLLGATLVRDRIRTRRHGHTHEHEQASGPLGWRPLLALGFSGGIVPSASALLLLLGAIHFERIALGLALIVAFGIGMALTLVGVGLALVGAARVAQRTATRGRVLRRGIGLVPELTAVIVLAFGIGMTAQALLGVI